MDVFIWNEVEKEDKKNKMLNIFFTILKGRKQLSMRTNQSQEALSENKKNK